MDICNNRKARYDYHILDTIEAGIMLQGTEVKTLRVQGASLEGSYAVVRNNELWLVGSHIEEYNFGNIHNHEPKRDRKLLLKKVEIRNFAEKAKTKGHTLVPLRMYFKGGKAKVEIAVCKGKQLHDKRQSLKDREQEREMKGY